MKNTIFMHMVGPTYLGWAKVFSAIFLICLITFYAKLVDWLQKTTLIYVMSAAYATIFFVTSFLLRHPDIGLPNITPHKYRIFGWVLYFVIESFGSLVVALFWSFVASSLDPKIAKKGYPVIVFCAQFGSVFGNLLNIQFAYKGLPLLFFIASCGVSLVPFVIAFFMKKFKHELPKQIEKKKPTGAIEGARLLLSKPYLLGILAVSTLYEVVGTIFDYQMNNLAKQTYQASETVLVFLAKFGLCANLLALTFAFLGTSFFIRRLGLTFCLVAFPSLIAGLVVFTWSWPIVWSFFTAMILLRGLTYSLNNPAKEIMYLPTSKDVKFKTKSWIDVFGARSAKASGGVVTTIFPILSQLLVAGSLISLGVIGGWIAIALYVGTTNKRLVETNQTIS
jgi:AAA family ATP:ADP antiporter